MKPTRTAQLLAKDAKIQRKLDLCNAQRLVAEGDIDAARALFAKHGIELHVAPLAN